MASRELLYQSYDAHPRHAEVRGTGLDPVFRAHLRGWLPEDRDAPILDLGCGDGTLLGFLAREGYRDLTGVDGAALQVERARAAAPSAEVVLGTGSELLARNPGRFETILCMDVLEHLTRDELLATVRVAADALRPGGWLVARLPNPESPFHAVIRYGDLTHELSIAPFAIEHLLAVSGLEDVEFREAGPVVGGWKSALRAALWAVLRQLVRAWNLIETGMAGSGAYTRVFYVRARRQVDPAAQRSPST